MKLKNRLVADDLYEFLSSEKLVMKVEDNHLVRKIDETSSMSYPYDSEDDALDDSIVIAKLREKIEK